jgi:hypothetical protein
MLASQEKMQKTTSKNRVPWTTQSFIDRAKNVHGDRYGYHLVDYKNVDTKVKIVCEEHGVFEQTPYNHMKGKHCQLCAGNVLLSRQEYIDKVTLVHDNKYVYDKTVYLGATKKIIVLCEEHGEFRPRAGNHLHNKAGCPKCAIGNPKIESEWLDSFFNDNIIRQHRISLSDGSVVVADGYDPETNTVYEFWGDFWHGNLSVHLAEDINPRNKLSFGELNKLTQEKILKYKQNGYNLIEMWENDFTRMGN